MLGLRDLLGWFSQRLETVLVLTRLGPVRGTTLENKKGETIFAFRGVPYAQPPVGELRFRRSRPVGAWSREWDATKDSPKSLQPNVLLPDLHWLRSGGEDCLYLNIYSKKTRGLDQEPLSKVLSMNVKPIVANKIS